MVQILALSTKDIHKIKMYKYMVEYLYIPLSNTPNNASFNFYKNLTGLTKHSSVEMMHCCVLVLVSVSAIDFHCSGDSGFVW